MSAYSTLYVTRAEAEEMVRAVRAKRTSQDAVSLLSNDELDRELHEYVYSENHCDVVGTLHNYMITDQ